MGNDGSKDGVSRTRSHTATGGGATLRGGSSGRLRTQTVAAGFPPAGSGFPPVTENDFLREHAKQNPTEQDFMTNWKAKDTETVRKRNDEICSKLALGFAQVDTDRDGFIEHNKVTRIYKQVCKLADAVYSTPVLASERVGFLQWNNLFKNIPASDKHLAKALKNLDFLSFKDPGDTTSTKSYLDLLPEDEESRRKAVSSSGSSEGGIPRKSSTGTPPNSKIPSVVTVHSPPNTTSTISSTSSPTSETKRLQPAPTSTFTTSTTTTTTSSTTKETGTLTSKPRKTSNIKPSTPPVLPTSKRPQLPNKEKEKRGTGLRPPVPQSKGRRSRANTGDSDISAASSVGDVTDLDDIVDGEEDFGVADADIPPSKPASATTTSPLTTTAGGAATSPEGAGSPVLRVDDDDEDDTNQSIIARANAVWS